jgi:hypothetical protein
MAAPELYTLDLLRKIAACCRRGDYADASSQLNVVIQKLQPVLLSGSVDQELLKKVLYSLETAHLMQRQEDYVALADVIEYELIDLLSSLFPPGN